MKIVSLIMGTATLVLGCYLATQVSSSLNDEQPVLIATPNSVDLGELRQNVEAVGTIQLENRSNAQIMIHDVATSCSCSIVKNFKTNLAPGEKCNMDVIWKVGRSRGKVRTRVAIVYSTKERETEYLHAELVAYVHPDIEFSPEEIVFDRDDPKQVVLHFKSKTLENFSLIKAYTKHDGFQLSLDQENKCLMIDLDTSKWVNVDLPKSTSLFLETTSENEPNLEIPIRVIENNKEPRNARQEF